MLVFEQQLIF